jgi:hypothetical protein
MKKILIPWQLFRQSLVLRTADNLGSWLDRWCYGDAGAVLIGRAVSVNESPSRDVGNHDPVVHRAPPTRFFMPHQPTRASGRAKPIILPVDRRVLDCFHEL